MTSPISLTAYVKDGKFCLSDAQKKITSVFMQRNEGKHVRVAFSQPGKPRSNNQNRYYHSVPVAMIAAETGHTPEEIHEYLKAAFLPRSFVTVAGKEHQVTKSTASLTTAEMEDFLTAVRTFAAQELNMVIPLPNEIDF